MYYTYVLYSLKDHKHYIGYTSDLKKRFKEHISGKVASTKDRRPLELIYYEAYKENRLAKRQEKLYKTGQGRRIFNKRLKFD